MNEQLAPLLVALMADPSGRVRAAACLAMVNLVQSMEEAALMLHAQSEAGSADLVHTKAELHDGSLIRALHAVPVLTVP